MEKSRAIELLEHLAWDRDIERNPYGDALNMAIEALKAQLSKEGTTSDLISRQAALEKVRAMQTYKLFMGDDMILVNKAEVQTELMMLPPAQPERKKGEWLPDNNNAYEMRFVCSCCKESEVVPTIGFTKYKPLWDFCPNCGADMRGEKDG